MPYFFFLYVDVYSYKLFSGYCFCSTFGICIFVFILNNIILIPFVISFLTHWLFKNVLLNFHILVNFPVFLLLQIYIFILLWLEKIHCMTLIYGLTCGITWRMSHVHLSKICILLLLGGVVLYKSVRPNWCIVLLTSSIPYWFSICYSSNHWKWTLTSQLFFALLFGSGAEPSRPSRSPGTPFTICLFTDRSVLGLQSPAPVTLFGKLTLTSGVTVLAESRKFLEVLSPRVTEGWL